MGWIAHNYRFMNQLKTIILGFISLCLIGCQSQPEVLFENIYIGDTLESCLADGTVCYGDNEISSFELANSNIARSYFSNSEVTFDYNNTVKEIRLKFHQETPHKTAKGVFNDMTQYFCQRYQGMKTEEVDIVQIDKESQIKYNQSGIKHTWNTNTVKVAMTSYTNVVVDRTYRPNPSASGVDFHWVWEWAVDNIEGDFVELIISTK